MIFQSARAAEKIENRKEEDGKKREGYIPQIPAAEQEKVISAVEYNGGAEPERQKRPVGKAGEAQGPAGEGQGKGVQGHGGNTAQEQRKGIFQREKNVFRKSESQSQSYGKADSVGNPPERPALRNHDKGSGFYCFFNQAGNGESAQRGAFNSVDPFCMGKDFLLQKPGGKSGAKTRREREQKKPDTATKNADIPYQNKQDGNGGNSRK
jgi:hypothetical protein